MTYPQPPISPERMLREFHSKFPAAPGQSTADGGLSDEQCEFRHRLLLEEVIELRAAVGQRDRERILKEAADVVYAAVGTAVAFGLPFDAGLAEVHRSNMTKTANATCEATKGPGYRPADIASILGSEQ